ncbi:MAG TPA: ABC transporter permease, partial [Candidatus Limiplasma sp.]|nr:ABC transporter permease [Candidatus Limiplasma sp.]
MKGYRKYFGKKILWLVITFIAALLLNFILPRLMPGDPVAAMTAKQAKGLSEASAVKAIYDNYAREFGTNKPITEQFFTYVGNL